MEKVQKGKGGSAGPGHDTQTIARVVDKAKDVGFVKALQVSKHRMMTSLEEVNLRINYQEQVYRQKSEDFYTQLHDTRNDRRDIRLKIDVVRGQRNDYETELHEVRQAYLSSEAQNRALLAFPIMSSDNASSAVTYTSISSDSDGPSWGISLMDTGELPEIDPYEEVAQQGQAPPLSPAYVPDPMELDEHVPVYVPEPKHLEYHVPSDDDMQVENQPYADDASPIAESPRNIADSESMEEDSIDYPNEPEDDDEDLEEDHTDYPADGGDDDDEPSDDDEMMMILMMRMISPLRTRMITKRRRSTSLRPTLLRYLLWTMFLSWDTEAFETDESAPTPRSPQTRVPFSQTHLCRARNTVRLEPPMSSFIEACIAEHVVAPIPPTSPAYDQAPLGHRAAMIYMRDDIPEEDMPPQRRFILTTPPPGCDVAESSIAARLPRGQYDFVDTIKAGHGLNRSPGHDTQTIARVVD
nr:hypothetical protein [Tanacetum cinerariifolium]